MIRREFDVSEGDAYNRVLIDKAERKLRDLGYFKNVSITTAPGSAPDKVVVVVDVEDKSTGSFGVAAGVETTGGSTGLVGEVSMDEKNFLGRGQKVHLAVGGGLNEQSINASFTDPYFLGNHMSFTVSGYRTYSSASTSRPFKTTYDRRRRQLRPADHRRVDVRRRLQGEQHRLRELHRAAASALRVTYRSASSRPGSRLTSAVGWGVTYSTLDSRLDPHEGVYFRFAQDFAGVGGDARFIRTTADARLYTPLIEGSDVVGLLKVTGGNITGLGQSVATVDNFFKGGETIRGFASLGYGPRETTLRPGAWRQELRQRHRRSAVPAAGHSAGLGPAGRGLCRCRHPVGRRRAVELCGGACTIVRRHGDPLLGRRFDPVAVAVRSDPHGFRPGDHEEELRRPAVLPDRHQRAHSDRLIPDLREGRRITSAPLLLVTRPRGEHATLGAVEKRDALPRPNHRQFPEDGSKRRRRALIGRVLRRGRRIDG